MSSKVKVTLLVLGFVVSIVLSFGAGVGFILYNTHFPLATAPSSIPYASPQGLPADFSLMPEVFGVLKNDYVEKDKVDPYKLSQGAIKGMVEALGDPYTSYMDKEAFNLERSSLEGSFEGIGAQVAKTEKEGLIVIAPLPGTPAEKAGIRAGDRILQIDGQSTAKFSLNEAVSKIRGAKGTQVKLSILHEGDTKPVDITVTRASIEMKTVTWKSIDSFVYIRLSSFQMNTSREFRNALRDILRTQPKGIVLDMRTNPGGLLNEVVDVAREFLPGKVILYEEDRNGNRKTWTASKGGLVENIPLVVLVDSHSASGSEVLSGALQDYKRAVIIGVKTFGKGSVNTFKSFSDGSGLYITVGRWITPVANRKIEGLGLLPDIEALRTPEQQSQGIDPPLDKALEYLKTGVIPAGARQ